MHKNNRKKEKGMRMRIDTKQNKNESKKKNTKTAKRIPPKKTKMDD